jgi:hypothetical protein
LTTDDSSVTYNIGITDDSSSDITAGSVEELPPTGRIIGMNYTTLNYQKFFQVTMSDCEEGTTDDIF